MIWHCAVAK